MPQHMQEFYGKQERGAVCNQLPRMRGMPISFDCRAEKRGTVFSTFKNWVSDWSRVAFNSVSVKWKENVITMKELFSKQHHVGKALIIHHIGTYLTNRKLPKH